MKEQYQEIAEKLPKDVDNAIRVIEFEMRRKKQALAVIEAKTEPSENERIKVGRERDFMQNVNRLIEAFKRTFHAHLGKVPPSDPDLEFSVLGALMLETREASRQPGMGALPIEQVESFLKPEHFYREGNAIIYEAILGLHRQNQPIDMISVKNSLRKSGKLELVGGPFYLAEATSRVSSAASVDYHGRVLVEFAIKRQLIMICSQVLRNAYDDTNDVFELLDSARDQINECYTWIKQ